MSKGNIVLFEDDGEDRAKLITLFKKELKGTVTRVEAFAPDTASDVKKSKKQADESFEPYEEKIKKYLIAKKVNDCGLFVTDRDLSKTEGFLGLSEAAISRVADDLAIPICLYARGIKGNDLSKINRWSDYKIVLNSADLETIAHEGSAIYKGFTMIKKGFGKVDRKNIQSPAEILSIILKKPNLQNRLALYSAGDTHMLSDILLHGDKATKDIDKRIPRLLGYWLWDSILRFPGIVVNEIAAASYLNINPNDFKREDIRKLFSNAIYKGPFAEIRPLWWRDDLDEILIKTKCIDGIEYVRKKGMKASECKCSVDEKKTAGYYCMLTREPVCEDHSRSNISWFPAGADLARIKNSEYKKHAPWIGLS